MTKKLKRNSVQWVKHNEAELELYYDRVQFIYYCIYKGERIFFYFLFIQNIVIATVNLN